MTLSFIALASVLAQPSVELTWHAPADCSSHQVVLEALTSHVSGPFSVEVVVAPSATGFDVRVTTTGNSRSGHRALHVSGCAEAVEAAVTIATLAWQAQAQVSRRPLVSARTAASAAVAAPADRLSWRLGFGGSAVVGLLPAPAGAVSLVVGADWRSLGVDLEVGYTFRQHQRAGPTPRAAADYSALPFRLCAGPRADLGAVALGLCAGPAATIVWGFGSGVLAPGGGSALALSLDGAAILERRLTRDWRLRVGASIAVQLLRPSFSFEGGAALHSVSPLTGSVSIGAAWSIP